MTPSLIELLYNQQDLCSDFQYHGLDSALQLTSLRYSEICMQDPEKARYHLCIFLYSLNATLYHYVMFQLQTCSCENIFSPYQAPSGPLDHSSFQNEVRKIMLAYELYIRPCHAQNRHIVDACRFIQDHLGERLTLEQVADGIFVNKCYLCHLFKNCMHINFSEYVTRERIEKAKSLLSDPSLSVDQIADLCGFSSSAYFSTVFKKVSGCSPRAYRKKRSA